MIDPDGNIPGLRRGGFLGGHSCGRSARYSARRGLEKSRSLFSARCGRAGGLPAFSYCGLILLSSTRQRADPLRGMNLSKRSEYALRALIDLGIARELGRPILQVERIGRERKAPDQVSRADPHPVAGCGLRRDKARASSAAIRSPSRPARIKLGAVIRLLDGPLAPIACVSQTAYRRCTCPDEAHCGLRMLMLDVRNAIARILDRSTLGANRRDHTAKNAPRQSPAPFRPSILRARAIFFRRREPKSTAPALTNMNTDQPDWLKIVREKVETLRYGRGANRDPRFAASPRSSELRKHDDRGNCAASRRRAISDRPDTLEES